MIRLSRTQEGHLELSKDILQSLDNHGILCLSGDPKSMLMWSYYSNGHSGVTVRFNLTLENLAAIPEDFLIFQMNYLEDFPDVNYRVGTQELVYTVLGSKARAWEHESEWRMLLHRRTGFMKIRAAMIDGVILGLKTPPDYEAAIRQWIGERKSPTELFRIEHIPNSFRLQVCPA